MAPGTFGTLLGVALAWLAASDLWIAAAAAAVTLLGVPLAAYAERREGRKDPGSFVLDEVAGYLVAVLYLPPGWTVLGLAFVAFRLFDIAKPWPVRSLERLSGGWGVMLDDLAAGVYANLLVRLVLLAA